MAVTADKILTRVRSQLVDDGTTPRWTDAELLRHLSDGQRTIAALQPDFATKVAVVKLAVGTRQVLPADGRSLLSVTRNMGTDGATPGRAVRVIMREVIDAQNADWHAAAKAQAVYNYIYDPQDQRAFFVFPPSNGAGYVEINYQFTPPEITTTADTIALEDIYQTPLMDYVMFRANQKDADSSGGLASAQLFLQAFTLFIQGTEAGDIDNNANLQLTPFDSSKKATGK